VDCRDPFVPAGRIATVLLDTRGLVEGETFLLHLTGVAGDNHTRFIDPSASWISTQMDTDAKTPGIEGGGFLITVVPEPASLVLLGLGAVAWARRRG
jgi:hypothetical protein